VKEKRGRWAGGRSTAGVADHPGEITEEKKKENKEKILRK